MAEHVLDAIVAATRKRLDEVPARRNLVAAAQVATAERRMRGLRSLAAQLARNGPAIIAECKHASPSAGVLREPFDPRTLAAIYESAGAAAISVVTEIDFFRGDPRWIAEVRSAVALPVLRKDFIICPRQLYETALLGADAVLLIQRVLTTDQLAELLAVAHDLELEVLLELFADEDPAPAVASGARIIGINARDLQTFATDLDRVAEMASSLPGDRIKVAESGIHGREDLEKLHRAGFDAFLIGEHLVRADDPAVALRALLGQ